MSDRDAICARETARVESDMALQRTLSKLKQENAELSAGLAEERDSRRRQEEELTHEHQWRSSLEEELQVQLKLREQAERALLEVEKRLESVEVEQRKLCAVESARAQGLKEVSQLREEIVELCSALEMERARVKQLEAGRGMSAHFQEALAREQSDLTALRNLLSNALKERDDALEKALRLQDVNRSVEELHEQLAQATADREELNSKLGQQQRNFVSLQSTLTALYTGVKSGRLSEDLLQELRGATWGSRTPSPPPERHSEEPQCFSEEPVAYPVLGGIVSSPLRASRKLATMGEGSSEAAPVPMRPNQVAIHQENWESPSRRATPSPSRSPMAPVSAASGLPLLPRGKDSPK